MTVLGRKERIPPFPHPKDYAYRCRQFFRARSLPEFAAMARFQMVRETWLAWRHKTGTARELLIDPTNACNIRCKGCWANEYDARGSLSYEDLDRVCTEARRLGTLDILLTGGEPLLRKDDILRLAARHRKLFFGAFTNGTLVDDAFAVSAADLGNLSVFISIEGFREDNDFRRGEGTFDKAVEAMRRLREQGVAFGFSLCYHKKNWRAVTDDRFLDFLREQGAWLGWAFGYRPVGRSADMGLCLSAAEREEARARIDDYCRRRDFTVIDLFNSGHKAYGCVAAGSGYIHINAAGDVEPCAFCHYSDANIHDMPLADALRSPFFRAFRSAQPFSENPLRPCPMVDVPDAIVELCKRTGARSTHAADPESAQAFADKIRPLADEWAKWADRERTRLPAADLRRFRFLRGYLAWKSRLAGDRPGGHEGSDATDVVREVEDDAEATP
ncbi:MAG: radical SAM protein [Clostridia bacterium]|nr:radical SAM protein [Clostridia bacterium]